MTLTDDSFWLGQERITGGDFNTPADWALGAGWSIVGGQAVKVGGGGSFLQQNGILDTDRIFRTVFDMASASSAINVVLGASFDTVTPIMGENITSDICTANDNFAFQGGGDYTINSVSSKHFIEVA